MESFLFKACLNTMCQTVGWAFDSTRLRAVLLFIAILAALIVFQVITRIKFRDKQFKYPRVKAAMEEKGLMIKELFIIKGVNYPPRNIYIRIFKEEGIVELWASSKRKGSFKLMNTYEISCSSGTLGPKREEGDKQIPEGFYYIDRFNPLSKYYLSLGISYPNESDCIFGVRGRPGSDIFIHGGSKTVGCIPITDDSIKELYLIAVQAVSNGQDRIPVHIFPGRLDGESFNRLEEKFKDNKGLIIFWKNIKEGFDIFESTRHIPRITVGRDGRYIFHS